MAVTVIPWDELAATVRAYLVTNGIWDSRVHVTMAPVTSARPYVQIFLAGGGAQNIVKNKDASLLVTIKVIADTLAESLVGAAKISELLDDNGEQEGGASPVTGTEYEISNITEGLTISYVEQIENARSIYHGGAQYRVRMEER